MPEATVSIRVLKAHLSAYLRRVKAAETVLITERGEPIGRIVPVSEPIPVRMERMLQGGGAKWSRKPLRLSAPLARARGKRTVAELLLEQRERP